jgi:hypothetical protein
MVRHHVAQRAGRVVKAPTAPDTESLRDGDLHVIDVIAIPDRFEQSVGETQNQDVLHRLLAEIMIDAKDLALVEDATQIVIELLRGLQIGPERLLDDDAPPSVVGAREARLPELAGDWPKCRWRRRQIVETVAHGCARRIDLVQRLSQAFEALRIVRVALNEGRRTDQPLGDRCIDGSSAEFAQ